MQEHTDHKLIKGHASHRLHALSLLSLFIIVGAFFVFSFRTHQQISMIENRRLTQWPTYTMHELLDGKYTKAIERYVSDHFPGRAWLTDLAFVIKRYRGVLLDERVIVVKGAETGFEDVSQWASTEPSTQNSSEDHAATIVTTITSPIIISAVESVTDETIAVESVTDETIAVEPIFEVKKEATLEVNHADTEINTPIDEVSVSNEARISNQNISTEPITQPDQTITASPRLITDLHQPIISAPQPNTPPPQPIDPSPQSISPQAKPVQTPPQTQTVKPNLPSPSNQTRPLNIVGGVLLHEGQALFMFQGTDRGAQGYANAVNTWVELVAKKRPGMTSTVVVTPTSSHFYLPPAARARTTSEKKNLAAMQAALLPEVRFADVIAEMQEHQDQPLFYKSDHHWTGLGAYYAYRAWAKVAGVAALELSEFDKRSVPGVAGSFWSLTQAPELRHADKESYYYVPKTVTFDGTQYTGPQQKTPVPQPFFAEKSRGYIVFLGGDIPLLAANTNAGTGRTALVVKNSYGNAFAPYLLPHFDRVVVLDYRYVSRNIQDIVDTFGVTDLVFVNATITANSGAHQERMRQVARGSSTAWLTEAEKRRIKQQEQAQENVQSSQ